ncbi:protein of unknown function [Vibrio tapetis subsp. tapetis]|uniref:Uncharacterized protein n=1 Tax=Vibrio tapetis subsp. tapetis TaxID=1671868 RepID=A0A2N8ZFZ8_9VIBR|nr:protein of unknown function [Vibrio tapetis subsp. tapetis]
MEIASYSTLDLPKRSSETSGLIDIKTTYQPSYPQLNICG